MGSKKRSAWQKQKAEFNAHLNESSHMNWEDGFFNSPYDGAVSDFDRLDNIDAIFKRESNHLSELAQEKEAALREKACESKNRYATQEEAREALELCAEHGRRNLRIYKCKYCNGWHLTSKPKR